MLNHAHNTRKNIRVQSWVLLLGFMLMLLKFWAYYLTNANAILSDALESIANLVAGGVALFSLIYAAQPKDSNHPYGHGKIEFLAAGLEGGLIAVAGLAAAAKGMYAFFAPEPIDNLAEGMWLSAFGGAVNGVLGYWLVSQGKKTGSYILKADGSHLLTDALTSAGLVIGLLVVYLTGFQAIDNLIAIAFGGMIVYTGVKIIRTSVSGILDEADYQLLQQVADTVRSARKDCWVDVHNLRIIKYGYFLHLDTHLALPWYYGLSEVYAEIKDIEDKVNRGMDGKVELFIRPEPCKPAHCPFCSLHACPERQAAFEKKLDWSVESLIERHRDLANQPSG